MNDYQRGTGRTHRMLMEAITAAKEGKTVVIVASNSRHADNMLDLLMKLDTDIDHISVNITR